MQKKTGTNNKALRILHLIGSVYLLIAAGGMLIALPMGARSVSEKHGNMALYVLLILGFAAVFAFLGIRGILSYKKWKASQPDANPKNKPVRPEENAMSKAVKKELYKELGAGNLYAVKEAQQSSQADSLRLTHHYKQLADAYVHEENLFADNPKKKELEEQLLAGGKEAVTAIREYLISCGAGQVSYGWWNGAAGLTCMLRKIAGKDAEKDLNRLKNLPTNIWEYHTQVKETAEKELLELKKENGGYGADGRIPAEFAHAELLNLQNVGSPEKRLEQFFAMQDSVSAWSDKDKAFYYFIAGGAARVLFKDNKSSLAFYAAQVSCDPAPTSMGWQHLRETEGNNITDIPTPDSIKKMCEKYPLPQNMQETKDYAFGMNDISKDTKAADEAYTLDQGQDLTALFRLYPALDKAKIQAVGQKIYDAKIPLVSGVGGMHQLYMCFKQQMPMYAPELSRIWDGIGDWAD